MAPSRETGGQSSELRVAHFSGFVSAMRGPMRIGATATAAALVLCLLLLRAAGADARNATGGLASPHVLFASIAFPNHLIPLARLAFEMRRRGYRVSFATNTPGRRWLRGLDAEVRPQQSSRSPPTPRAPASR